MAKDNLTAPLLRMARFFLIDGLPRVRDVRDAYKLARAYTDRGIVPTLGEERLLRQAVFCMLEIERDPDDTTKGGLHRSFARLAAFVLAVIEDDDLSIPDDRKISRRADLEHLALQLEADCEQQELQIGSAIGVRDLSIRGAADVTALQGKIKREEKDEQLERTLQRAIIHLRQGEDILAGQTDGARAKRHRARFKEACTRTTYLIARLLAIPATQDVSVVRGNLVRRELKRIEVDALGTERLTEVEQVRKAKELLAWTAVDVGETPTAENRTQLAAELRKAAAAEPGGEDGEEGWLFSMGES